MLTFERIKAYYDNKLWTKPMVWDSVGKNKITEIEYENITGCVYTSERPTS